jgi:hypothetical protein
MGSQYEPVKPPASSRFRGFTKRFGIPISPLYVEEQSIILMKQAGEDDPLEFRDDVYDRLIEDCRVAMVGKAGVDYTMVHTALIGEGYTEAIIIIFFSHGRRFVELEEEDIIKVKEVLAKHGVVQEPGWYPL